MCIMFASTGKCTQPLKEQKKGSPFLGHLNKAVLVGGSTTRRSKAKMSHQFLAHLTKMDQASI